MNKNNRRSSLRKAPGNEDETTTTAMRIKRRISFSGKKSVREFVNTEEPKNWDNSYEVSDHLNVDSSGSGSGTSSHTKSLSGEDKENISLPAAASICERSHIDITLNLQTSVDVTLLPCELLRKQQQKPLAEVRDSLALSLEERQRLQDTIYDRRIMDKTLDLMSGSLVARMQKATLPPPELAAPNTERENRVHATAAANCISDSFMDITPLAFDAPPPAPAPAPVAPASHPIQQGEPEEIELEMFDDRRHLIMNEKENVNPAQKSLLMEMEEAGKQIKNKTQHEVVDISFNCSLNVSPERDISPLANMSFKSASSANSTINYKDESMLIPQDMVSGKRISKKINLRQLNDELEAGKIQLFPNGPKTPTTDRKSQKNRFWHGLGQEEMDAEEGCPTRDIRSSIKPRAMLNFSESMALSPPPVRKELKDKAKDKDWEDKRKYRLSQADEMMLDNTNFLAHARLGDETQSRNSSKNSTRRETTYDYSELDLEGPTSRLDFHHPPMPSSKPRQTIHQPEEIEADQSVALPAIPAPPRRTLYMNESMDQEKGTREEPQAPVYATMRTKRRETLVMQVSMEEEMDFSLKDPPDGYQKAAKARQTLLLSEPIREELPKEQATFYPSNKSRKTITMSEGIEEDMSILQPEEMQQELPAAIPGVKTSLPRRTLYMNESIEPDVEKTVQVEARKEEKATISEHYGNHKANKRRQTILMQESMEEEIVSPLKELNLKSSAVPVEKGKPKARHTLHMAEPLEVEKDLPLKEFAPPKSQLKSRQTLLLDEAMEEEMDTSMKDSPQKPTEKQSNLYSNSKCRKTIIMSKPIEEDEAVDIDREASSETNSRQMLVLAASTETEMSSKAKQPSKCRKTLNNPEPIEEDDIVPHLKEHSNYYQLSRPRKTIIKSEPMEEEQKQTLLSAANQPSKCRKTFIYPEPIEEDDIAPHLKEQSPPKLPRHTQYLGEPLEEEMLSKEKDHSNYYQPSRPRKTIIQSEPMEEEQKQTLLLEAHTETGMRLKANEKSNLNQSSQCRKTLSNPEPIEEDDIAPHSNYYQPSRPRKTIIKPEPMEEEQRHNTTESFSVPYQQKKSRQTFVMAEPIEEDHHEAFKANKAEIPRPKSRNTILMAEPILEDLSVCKPVSLDYQSPQETRQNTNIQVITPLPNPRLTSLYRELGNFTPGMSLTEFEDQEEMCKTPLPSAKQKQRSIYQPTKMELMDASGLGTPVRHGAHKRQPKHLTPNLPESKKRHTQLFADSHMEMEVEMEEGAWEGANIELETHKARSTFRFDQFDETVQPVRDYRPPLSQLVKVSSLDEVLEVKQQSELEEKPITISDVTNYFLQEKQQEEQRKSSDRESGASSSDRTFKSYAATNTKFINLSGDTTIFAGAVDLDEAEEEEPQNQIDNEQISLVSTLAEETVENEGNEQPELCQDQITPLVIAGSRGSCKKCANCNRSLSETTLSADSFILPQQNLFDFTKERQRLRRLRLKPSYEEMQKHWEMKSLEMVNDSLDETKVEEKPCHWDKAKLMQKLKRPPSRRNRAIAPAKSRESFFDRLDLLLAEQQPNWIFDFQLKVSRQLIFYHRLLTTFRIVVNYKVLDDQDESAIRVCSITEDNAVASPPERWTTFDHYLNFQLSLKMPMNLTDAIVGSDVECFRKFLHRIDQSVVEIKRTFHKLMTVLTATNARLLRQSNRIFVRRTVIKCIENEPLIRFDRLNFLVQITNVEEICFSDVLQPELHLFNENLQFLPKGIAFLEAFLPNPEQYLKMQT